MTTATANRPPSVLTIWIPGQGFVRQGKYFTQNGKSFFSANMTERKLWRNYNGYGIARRILEALPRGTVIVYKRADQNSYYLTNKSRFASKGVLVGYGGHSQFVLPIKQWTPKVGQFEEPHQLPVMSLDRWLKASPEKVARTAPRERSGDVSSQRPNTEGWQKNRELILSAIA